jgi:predicted DNA-binding transcriptional regulator AlpA
MIQRPQSKIVRPADLKADYHLADTTIRGWEEQNLFPRRRKFGPRVTGWFRDDFEAALRRISNGDSQVHTPTDLNRRASPVTATPREEGAQ